MLGFDAAKLDQIITEQAGSVYTSCSFDTFTDKKTAAAVLRHADDNDWLYIYGDSRTGKTHLAVALFKHLVMSGRHGVRFRKCIALDMLFSAYDSENRKERIEEIKTASILFIDDLGVGKLTHERHSMYYYIVDYRISNNKKTIITSNYKSKDLWSDGVDVSPARIITRIQEAATGIEVKKQ
jgi:DNA replication protein DnaC